MIWLGLAYVVGACLTLLVVFAVEQDHSFRETAGMALTDSRLGSVFVMVVWPVLLVVLAGAVLSGPSR